jgi:hypothetical protein
MEDKMKLRTKIGIFIAAALLTLAGFNLIASSAGQALFNYGKTSNYEIVVKAAPAAESKTHPVS